MYSWSESEFTSMCDTLRLHNARHWDYEAGMSSLSRIVIIILLALFASSTIVLSAASNSMSLKMALSNADTTDMKSCEGCGSGEVSGMANCDIDCTISFPANLLEGEFRSFRSAGSMDQPGWIFPAGRIGRLDPQPPRFFI